MTVSAGCLAATRSGARPFAPRSALRPKRPFCRRPSLLLHDPDVPELHGVAVALQLERAGGAFGVAAVAARRAADLLVLDGEDAVVLEGDPGVLDLLFVLPHGVREVHVVGLPDQRR